MIIIDLDQNDIELLIKITEQAAEDDKENHKLRYIVAALEDWSDYWSE